MSFLKDLYESVAAEVGSKRADKRRAVEAAADALLPPPPPPAAETLAALDAHMKSVEAVHAQAEREARQQYLTLLGLLAPPRSGPAPSTDAHALATPPAGEAPSPERILELLRAVGRTPERLREDVVRWATIRDQADLAARREEFLADLRQAEAVARDLQAEYERVQVDWETKIEVQRRVVTTATSRSHAADNAKNALVRAQRFDEDPRATPSASEEPTAEQEEGDPRDAILDRAVRLLEIERVFFPPSARDPGTRVVRDVGSTWTYRHTPPEGRP